MEYGLLMKGVCEIKMKQKNKGGFLSMLLDTWVVSLLGNLLTGKALKAKLPGQGVAKAGEATIRADQYF